MYNKGQEVLLDLKNSDERGLKNFLNRMLDVSNVNNQKLKLINLEKYADTTAVEFEFITRKFASRSNNRLILLTNNLDKLERDLKDIEDRESDLVFLNLEHFLIDINVNIPSNRELNICQNRLIIVYQELIFQLLLTNSLKTEL